MRLDDLRINFYYDKPLIQHDGSITMQWKAFRWTRKRCHKDLFLFCICAFNHVRSSPEKNKASMALFCMSEEMAGFARYVIVTCVRTSLSWDAIREFDGCHCCHR
jgi:hypothetical protein